MEQDKENVARLLMLSKVFTLYMLLFDAFPEYKIYGWMDEATLTIHIIGQ